MTFIVRVLVNALAIWFTTLFLGSHFEVRGGSSTFGVLMVYVGVALIFAIVNAVLKPILQVISLPFYILTLGLFGLVINALVLLLVSWITGGNEWGLHITGFWWAVLAGIIVTIMNAVLSGLLGIGRPRPGTALTR